MLDRSTFPVGSHRRADRTIRPTGWNYQKSYSPEGNEEGELHADLNRVITSFIIHYLGWQAFDDCEGLVKQFLDSKIISHLRAGKKRFCIAVSSRLRR
jgi:hypothetical protein